MKKVKLLIFIMALVASLSACGGKAELRFGAGDRGGMYYAYAEKLSQLAGDKLNFRIRTTTGSAANIRLLQKGYLDTAIVQNDNLYDIAEVTEEDLGFSAACGLYTEAIQVVVRADSDIRTLEDLMGKRVSVGEESSGTELNAGRLLSLYGIGYSEMDTRYLPLSDACTALREGSIDAFFYTAGAPTQGLSDLSKETPIRLIPVPEENVRRMKNLYPDYVECIIPAGTYGGQTEDVHTVGVRAILLVSNDLDNETVRQLMDIVFGNSDSLNAALLTESGFSAEEAARSIYIPFHPGAASYLKEKGVEVKPSENKGSSPVMGGQDE